MNIKPLKPELVAYLKQHRLEKKFDKAKQLSRYQVQLGHACREVLLYGVQIVKRNLVTS